ncbi:MAG: J domain-containing protein [Chloroflexota bacterium]|nr:J domain-containing protein [Chloroflexota bacterium]
MPVQYKDYYKTLGVSKDAAAADIKKAYRKLARQHHPDVNKTAGAEKRFKEINEANEVLSDPEKRTRYDSLGPGWEQYAQQGGGAGARDGFQWVYTTPGGGRGTFGEDAGGFSDFFRTIFGDASGPQTGDETFGRRRARARAGADLEHDLEISLAEAYRGTDRTVQVRRPDGTVRSLDVKIPPGVRDAQRVRLAGQGGSGAGGGPAGDLFLRVHVRPHPFFERDRDDLRAELPVALHEALLGAEVTLPTLKGRVTLRIPPETQNGRTIRLAGQGMPRAGGGYGDLYVTVKVVMPQKLTDRERELAHELASRRGGENVRSHLL